MLQLHLSFWEAILTRELHDRPSVVETNLITPISNLRRRDNKKLTLDKSPAALEGYKSLAAAPPIRRFQKQKDRKQARAPAEALQKAFPADVAEDAGPQQAYHDSADGQFQQSDRLLEANGDNASHLSQNLEDCIRNAQQALALISANEPQQSPPAFNEDLKHKEEDASHR